MNERKIIKIETPSESIPVYADNETINCIDLPNHVRLWEFVCPICEEELSLDSKHMKNDEENESSWIGNCPCCKVKIVFHRPD